MKANNFLLMFLFLLSMNTIFSTTKITQINFKKPEFIELSSSNQINLSTLIDEDKNHSNTLTKLKTSPTSNNYLIIGNDFINVFNISSLNYTIYTTNKNGLGYRGLKDAGENFTIYYNINNLSNNVSWNNFEKYSFNKNETLHIINNETKITNLTLNYIRIIEQNISQIQPSNKEIYSINITTQKIFFTDKLKFKFETNATNYSIEYWITDYFNNTLKSKRNTSNVNQKTFTPRIKNSSILFIKANLFINNTKINSTKKTIFFQTNTQKSSTIINQPICEFSILPLKEYFTDKLKFKFKTNQKNYSIKYWIEDLNSNILKSPKITKNLNQKTFTPELKQTNLYKIKANFTNENCSLNISKIVFFLNKEKSNFSNSSIFESYIIIKNLEDLKNKQTNTLNLEVFRGSTNKRTIYIYNNNKLITSFELDKFSKISSKILLDLSKNKNNIKIIGLDLFQNFTIFNNNTNTINNAKSEFSTKILQKESISKQSKQFSNKFQIINFTINKTKLNFSINSTINNLTFLCYVLNKRTKISSIFNYSETRNNSIPTIINLTLNKTKIINQELKLLCKYKKQQNKNYLYSSIKFNYSQIKINSNITTKLKQSQTKEIEPKNSKTIPLLKYKISSNSTLFHKFLLTTNNTKILSNNPTIEKSPLSKKFLSKTKPKIESTFVDKSLSLKNKSYLFIFSGSFLIFITMIIIW